VFCRLKVRGEVGEVDRGSLRPLIRCQEDVTDGKHSNLSRIFGLRGALVVRIMFVELL